MFYDKKLNKINHTSGSVGYLAKAKVRSLMFASMIDAVDSIIMTATDKVILGNMIGSDAISATMLVAPVIMFSLIFGTLISTGTSVLYTRAVGNYDTEKSRRILGMSGILSLVIGMLLSAASFAWGNSILEIMGAEGRVLEYGIQYLYFLRFTFIISPLHSVLNEILYVDGDEIRVIISSISLVVCNALVSILLIPHLGIMGASLGSAIGILLAFLISFSHFFSEKYRIRPILSFDPDVFKEMFLIGGVDALDGAAGCLYVFIIEIFVIKILGSEYLAVIAVTGLVYDMMAIGGGVNDSMKTMLISYWGDRNKEAMKSLLLFGVRLTLNIGILYIAIVWILSPFLPRLYGIDSAALSSFTITACRITSFASVAYIFYGLFLDYYGNIGKYRLQLVGDLLDTIIARLPVVFILGFSIGPVGLWIGEALCPYICLFVLSFIAIKMYGIDMFPFLIEKGSGSSLNYSYQANVDEIIDMRDRVESFLVEKKAPRRAVNFCMLLIEDMSMLIKEANPEKECVHIDAFVSCDTENARLVLWNDGKPIDMSDTDMVPSSIRSYLVSSLLTDFEERKYQKTSGYNRTSFVIPYKRLINEQMKAKA